mmetsp:Transcript_27929/g.38802  ORF Transcript_27929/g.38802 Transcript_27929/m.38802 type:complete len:228 (+) Transcript_27929:98-781(+)
MDPISIGAIVTISKSLIESTESLISNLILRMDKKAERFEAYIETIDLVGIQLILIIENILGSFTTLLMQPDSFLVIINQIEGLMVIFLTKVNNAYLHNNISIKQIQRVNSPNQNKKREYINIRIDSIPLYYIMREYDKLITAFNYTYDRQVILVITKIFDICNAHSFLRDKHNQFLIQEIHDFVDYLYARALAKYTAIISTNPKSRRSIIERLEYKSAFKDNLLNKL